MKLFFNPPIESIDIYSPTDLNHTVVDFLATLKDFRDHEARENAILVMKTQIVEIRELRSKLIQLVEC